MQSFNRIMASIFVALVAAILVLTAASFAGVRPQDDASLLASDCESSDAVAEVAFAGMKAPSC